ncbi:MAG: WD40/YVTN/BNR-like repeat-containing protein [Desulfobacterales bacterium]
MATSIGLLIITQANGHWNIVAHALTDKSLTSVVALEGVILAGTAEGIWRSSDNGQSWSEDNATLTIRHVRWMAGSADAPSLIFVGTEPACIFVSRNRGKTWHQKAEVAELRDKYGWFLPYSPEAGCVRGFSIAESGPHRSRIYAAVEVGGVLISDDGGQEWHLAEGSDGKPEVNRELGVKIHPDVHSISVHPSSSDIVTAATGGGLYHSIDGGIIWKCIYRCYIRAAWVDPQDVRHIIAGPADGVSRNGRIEETHDGGQSWQAASIGMNGSWPRHMVERFYQHDKNLFAILSNGELWTRTSGQAAWQCTLSELTGIHAMAASK